MGLICEFTTAASTFAVGRALDGDADQTVELERIVPTDERMVPFFWLWGHDVEGFETRLGDEDGVLVDDPIARTDRGALFRIEWTGAMSTVVRGLFDQEFTLLSGRANAERWRFQIRFDDRDAASTFRQHLVEHDVPHELTRVQGVTDLTPRSSFGLTAKQRDALLAAYDGGYFSVPRDMTVGELSERLDIAPSSASDRLRRGTERLVERSLITERELRRADVRPSNADR